jgi:hypothetical protein
MTFQRRRFLRCTLLSFFSPSLRELWRDRQGKRGYILRSLRSFAVKISRIPELETENPELETQNLDPLGRFDAPKLAAISTAYA